MEPVVPAAREQRPETAPRRPQRRAQEPAATAAPGDRSPGGVAVAPPRVALPDAESGPTPEEVRARLEKPPDRRVMMQRLTKAAAKTTLPKTNVVTTAAVLRESSAPVVEAPKKSRKAAAAATTSPVEPVSAPVSAEAPSEQRPGRRERRADKKAASVQAKIDAKAQKDVAKARRAKDAEPAEPAAPEPAAPRVKRTRRERRLDRQSRALGLVEGEEVTVSIDGRSRLRRYTLLVTTYRVALVPRRRRRGVRWIPLEEVQEITTAWRGAPSVAIEATVEMLSLQKRNGPALEAFLGVLEPEVRIARSPGGRRHHPEIVQAWCDRTGELWDSDVGKLRLWIRRHPIFSIVWLGSILGIVSLAMLETQVW